MEARGVQRSQKHGTATRNGNQEGAEEESTKKQEIEFLVFQLALKLELNLM